MPYYLIPHQFARHPIYQDILAVNPTLGFTSSAPPDSPQHRRDLHAHLNKQQPLTIPTNAADGGAAPAAHKFVVPASLAKFEKKVEQAYVNALSTECRHQVSALWSSPCEGCGNRENTSAYLSGLWVCLQIGNRDDQVQRAKGIFGIGADWDKIQKLTEMRLDRCDELNRMGYRAPY